MRPIDSRAAHRRRTRAPLTFLYVALIGSALAVGVPGPLLAQDAEDPSARELAEHLDSLRAEIQAIMEEELAEVRAQLDSLRSGSEGLWLLDGSREVTIPPFPEIPENLLVPDFPDSLDLVIDPEWMEEWADGRTPDWEEWVSRYQADSWRPLAPSLVMGDRFVAGAEVTDLNEGLGRYFGVDSGVLVLSVAAGSAAAEAGVEAGDVIVALGGEEVPGVAEARRVLRRSTLESLRRSMRDPGSERPELALEVIRDGERLELTLEVGE